MEKLLRGVEIGGSAGEVNLLSKCADGAGSGVDLGYNPVRSMTVYHPYVWDEAICGENLGKPTQESPGLTQARP